MSRRKNPPTNESKPQARKPTRHAEDKPPPDVSPYQISIKTIATVACIAVACCIGYKGYLETRVNTPFDSNKVVVKSGLAIPERYWGSYRPGTYFGMKSREPYAPVMGLMWYFPKYDGQSNGVHLRHWCEQDDGLEHYTWTHHDGKSFGVQELIDGPFSITTSFVKRIGGNHGGDWTARIKVAPREGTKPGNSDLYHESKYFIFYAATEAGSKGRISPSLNGVLPGVIGETPELGPFAVRLYNVSGDVLYHSYLSIGVKGLDLLSETIRTTLRIVLVDEVNHPRTPHIVLPGDMTSFRNEKVSPNFVAVQLEAKVPFEFDAVFESGSFIDRPNTFTGQAFSSALKQKVESFHSKFEDTFHLKAKGFSAEDVKFAEASFSNLIGGIGYFYGASRVQSEHTTTAVPYWKAPLYTAVPSRSFFPRGFLWDEGFHGLLLAAWDLDLELDIMSHWFDLMNVEGWIPREQILGEEALAKVPEEFVTQMNTNANPPTFFLTLRFIIQNFAERLTEEDRLGVLERLYPRLVAWFDWFNSTQVGPLPGSYRWRGRDSTTTRELNPKTLTSGLDDYPRASHPTDDERHLDLRSWIVLSASVLAEIAKVLNRPGDKYIDTFSFLTDSRLLDALHWSEEAGRYCDYGLHTDDVTLKRPPPPPGPVHQHKPVQQEMKRVVLTDPRLRFVDSSFGYVSLFPLFVHGLSSNSPKLQKLLTDLRNPQLLWTNYGLRSLAKNSPLYMQRNTEHDPPYWRGAIWININYLTLGALHYYSQLSGPYQTQAADLYKQLRQNLISNMVKQYKKSGYIWEQYDDTTGEGKGSRPFTGWSSLIVLIMAEMY